MNYPVIVLSYSISIAHNGMVVSVVLEIESYSYVHWSSAPLLKCIHLLAVDQTLSSFHFPSNVAWFRLHEIKEHWFTTIRCEAVSLMSYNICIGINTSRSAKIINIQNAWSSYARARQSTMQGRKKWVQVLLRGSTHNSVIHPHIFLYSLMYISTHVKCVRTANLYLDFIFSFLFYKVLKVKGFLNIGSNKEFRPTAIIQWSTIRIDDYNCSNK